MFDFSNPAVFLSWMIFFPALVAIVIALLPARGETIKRIALVSTVIVFFMSLGMILGVGDWPRFEAGEANMQNLFALDWIPSFGISYAVGVDAFNYKIFAA